MRKILQRAVCAQRIAFFAEVLAELNNKGVIFVKKLNVLGQIIGEGFLDLMILSWFRQQEVPKKNTVGIGVDYKNRMVARIEQD